MQEIVHLKYGGILLCCLLYLTRLRQRLQRLGICQKVTIWYINHKSPLIKGLSKLIIDFMRESVICNINLMAIEF